MRYFCKIDDGEEAGWQGPYENLSPRAAASLWIKREWDCRHREKVRVLVKDEGGLVQAVTMMARIQLIVEHEAEPLGEAV